MLNLAHCHRKLKQMDEAIAAYERCLTINPKSCQTLMALGFTYHLKFDLKKALHFYHKAHFLQNENSLIRQLISRAIDDINNPQLCAIETTYLQQQPPTVQATASQHQVMTQQEWIQSQMGGAPPG